MLKKLFKLINIKFSFKGKSILDYNIHPSSLLYNKKNIIASKSSLIAEYAILRAPQSIIEIGDFSQIGPFSVLLSGEYGIKIGKYVMIGPNCVIAAGNHEFRDLSKPMRFSGSFSAGPIIINDDVWIGANCTIGDNVIIGKGVIIGANSYVNKNIEDYSIVGGVPARYISNRKETL